MAVSLKHKFQSAIPDSGDTTIVQPSNWNDDHDLTMAADRILGRVATGSGAAEELTSAQVRALLNVADGATANSADATLLARANHTGTQTLSTISDAGTAAAQSDTRYNHRSNNLSDVADAPTARTNLGLAIGTNVQAYDADLAAIAGLTSANGKLIRFTGSGTAEVIDHIVWYAFAISDEATALTTGTAKGTLRLPFAATLLAVYASVTTAPTGAALQFDINEEGVSLLSTKLTIDATEKSSHTAATAAVISDSAIAAYAELTYDIDVVGSTIAGAGAKIWIGVRPV